MPLADYDRQAARYDLGRSLLPETITAWMTAAAEHLPTDAPRILDLGAATGRFSVPLADAFSADVLAVEPSAGMREEAKAKRHPWVHPLAGAAEAIPLADQTCDAAWLSNVIHHFDNLAAAARELRRVVFGPVLIRGAFSGDTSSATTLYEFFPGARETIDLMPSTERTMEIFEGAGFSTRSLSSVSQVLARSWTDMYEKVKHRADSTLERLSDDNFDSGLEQLRLAAQSREGPVVDSLALLVVG